jgi:hypothetical protein
MHIDLNAENRLSNEPGQRMTPVNQPSAELTSFLEFLRRILAKEWIDQQSQTANHAMGSNPNR